MAPRPRCLITGTVTALALAALAIPSGAAAASSDLLGAAGRQLLSARVSTAQGGWAWRSVIQAPHLQTDRDVGTASVLNGLLALYQQTGRAEYLDGARRAGDWLLAVSEPASGGLRWADWVDGPTSRSDTYYTSFDDGTAGIADVLWRLGSLSGDPRYTRAALAGMRWEAARAQAVGASACPSSMCRWSWRDGAGSADYETGLGEGQAGIAYAFLAFAQRTGDPSLLGYARAGAAYLESLMGADGSIPERVGVSGVDAGYLSGMAGNAYVFLALYRQTGEARWLADAKRALAWLASHAVRSGSGVAWPIEVDTRGVNPNSARSTGIEEGAAGIGWVELQAYSVTGDPAYLDLARRAGAWLVSVARPSHGGLSWPQNAGESTAPTSLDNGAAGIGWFLADLAQATHEPRFSSAADAAGQWLKSVATTTTSGATWPGHDGVTTLDGDSSWHWGAAGIAAFLARLAGGVADTPGEEPALAGAQPRARTLVVGRGASRAPAYPPGSKAARGGVLATLPRRAARLAGLIQIS